MKFCTNRASLLLLLLPTLTSAAAAPAAAQIDSELRAVSSSDDSTDSNSVNVGSRHGVPTRDAPVDGKDGKPHLGPFVETTVSSDSERELPRLKGRPNDPTIVDGQRIPETNDGVMFDKNREHPLEGTTGTEGGVTEKDRTRKDQELQVGGKIQTQPEAPKEQLPMPHSEELKIQSNEKGKDAAKQVVSGSEDSNAYTGLDVSLISIVWN
jgi:Ca2+/H+ antiporter, TMEM165/GDT1 family